MSESGMQELINFSSRTSELQKRHSNPEMPKPQTVEKMNPQEIQETDKKANETLAQQKNEINGLNNLLKKLQVTFGLDQKEIKISNNSTETKGKYGRESLESRLNPENFIEAAREHLGKPYRLGGNGDKYIDCSQLVVESLKSNGIVPSSYDKNAYGFYKESDLKDPSTASPGDLAFIKGRAKWNGAPVKHVAIVTGPAYQEGGVRKLPVIEATGDRRAGRQVVERERTVSSRVAVGSHKYA